MSLGESIYKFRLSKNWSQTDLANALEVSRQSVSKWENNTATPDLDIFNVTLNELIFDKKPMEQESNPPYRCAHTFQTFVLSLERLC